MNVCTATPAPHADLPPAAAAVLLTGSAGFLFANLTAQVLRAHLGVHTTPVMSGEWATAAYTLTSFVGVITAQPLERRLGVRRYFVAGAWILATFGWLQALAPTEPTLLAMRAFEGFASGSFGPRALLGAFLLCRSGRLPMPMTVASLFVLVAAVIGFVIFGASDPLVGWRGLFLVQAALGVLMALAGLRWLPRARQASPSQSAQACVPLPNQRSAACSRRRRRRHGNATTLASRSTAA